jgi:hypothetical protein
LVEEFLALGVAATFDPDRGLVLVPRGPDTPTWGYTEPPRLGIAVTIGDLGGGWSLCLDLKGTYIGGRRRALHSGRCRGTGQLGQRRAARQSLSQGVNG